MKTMQWLGCLSGIVMLLTPAAQAATRDWTNTVGGFFSVPGNWSGGNVPGTGDVAQFNIDAAYTVTFDQNVSNLSFKVPKGQVTWDLNGYTYTFTNWSAQSFLIGNPASAWAQLTVTGGVMNVATSVSASYFYVGGASGTGTFNIVGANTTVDVSRVIGYGMRIYEPAQVRVSGGATLIGVFTVGGNLSVVNGGVVTNSGLAVGSATAGVEAGEVIVTNGGCAHFTASYCNIGSGAKPCRVLISDPNSVLYADSTYTLIAAASANAEITVTNGGYFYSKGTFDIGYAPAGNVKTASVAVAGANARIESPNSVQLNKFGGGVGSLTIGNGGGAYLKNASCGTNSTITVAAGGFLSITGSSAGAVTIYSSGVLQGDGVIRGDRVGDSYLRPYGGTIRPGLPLGTLLVSNFVVQATSEIARLELEIGGTAEGQYDRLIAVTGNYASATVSLGGTCAVTLVNGFVPQAGDTFNILDWSVLATNRFAGIVLPALPASKEWRTNNFYTLGELSVIGGITSPGLLIMVL